VLGPFDVPCSLARVDRVARRTARRPGPWTGPARGTCSHAVRAGVVDGQRTPW